MIGFLSGTIHRKSEQSVVVDVRGVGYEVFVSKRVLLTSGEPGDAVSFEVYTHVGEATFQLYGFVNVREKQVFQKLIGISGVGPKLALSVLSDLSVPDLLTAITQGQVHTLTRISGVGKKTAERMVIELKDKFEDEAFQVATVAANDDAVSAGLSEDVVSALLHLGYTESLARKVVAGLEVREGDSVQTLIKKSLAVMQQ